MAAMTTVGRNERKEQRAASPPYTNRRPVPDFLIANLPIRNRRNFCALNKNPISNRQKNGIFRPPVTYNLKPATVLPHRNSQELKTDVTP